jgi:hypothetical protein
MVIKIIPASHSGSATIVGAIDIDSVGASIDIDSGQMIDTATGNIILPGALHSGTIMEGSWEPHCPFASGGQYSWTKPYQTLARELKAEKPVRSICARRSYLLSAQSRGHNSNRYTSYRGDGRQRFGPHTKRSSNLRSFLRYLACHRTMHSFGECCATIIQLLR